MLWPLLVIVLPLAGMAGLVWWTLGADRRAAEAAAKARGQELAEAVMNRVREAIEVKLAVRFGSASPGWPSATDRGAWSELRGISLIHLAVLKVLDLAGDRWEALPPSWRSHPWRVISIIAGSPPSPLAEACIVRLRRFAPEWVAGAGDPNLTVEALFAPWDRPCRARAIYRQALGMGGDRSGLARAPLWVEHQEEPWLLWPATLVGGVFGDGHRTLVTVPESLLSERAAEAWAREDRRGDFAMQIEIAGRVLPDPSGMRWQGVNQPATGVDDDRDWAARVYAPAGSITVTTWLADPRGYLAALDRRHRRL